MFRMDFRKMSREMKYIKYDPDMQNLLATVP